MGATFESIKSPTYFEPLTAQRISRIKRIIDKHTKINNEVKYSNPPGSKQ